MASFLDGIIDSIFGPNETKMSEEDRKDTESARRRDRKDASQMAFSARKNPGAQFMNGPESSGLMESGGLLESIGKIFKLFGAGGG